MEINQLLQATIEKKASDLHIIPEYFPSIRINNELLFLRSFGVTTGEDTEKLILPLLTDNQRNYLNENKEIDLGWDYEGNRFRINVYTNKKKLGAAFRLIPNHIKTIDELNLPSFFHTFTAYKQGLILFTGPTGEGKSTSLASIINEIFIKAITSGLPFVVYKTAMTLDGKIATETGDSRWVSQEGSRHYVHQLRDRYDVILVGSETVIQDNPALTCRLPGGKDPIRLIVDGQLRIPENAQVLSASECSPCIIATTQAASMDKVERLNSLKQVKVWQYDTPRHVPLEKLLRDLVSRGWTSVLLEGGGGLAGTLIKEHYVDKLEFFIAPKLVGGNGPSPLSGLHIQHMADALELHDLHIDMNSGDLHITGYTSKSEARG